MPEKVIEEMKAGYSGSGLSEKEINRRVYGHLNKTGAMHGSKVTAKGEAMEEKYERDHPGASKKKGHKDKGREQREALGG